MNEQCSIFDFVDDEYIYKINKPIRLIEFFPCARAKTFGKEVN